VFVGVHTKHFKRIRKQAQVLILIRLPSLYWSLDLKIDSFRLTPQIQLPVWSKNRNGNFLQCQT